MLVKEIKIPHRYRDFSFPDHTDVFTPPIEINENGLYIKVPLSKDLQFYVDKHTLITIKLGTVDDKVFNLNLIDVKIKNRVMIAEVHKIN